MWHWAAAASSLVIVMAILYVSRLRGRHPEPHYDWSRIDLGDVAFPSDFLWGTATAAHQIEGGLTNNWSAFEEERGLERSGAACEHWTLWREDFGLLSEMGVGSYRFSIEWSRLEPEPGTWDEEAMRVYSDMVDDLISRGIRPMVTLSLIHI